MRRTLSVALFLGLVCTGWLLYAPVASQGLKFTMTEWTKMRAAYAEDDVRAGDGNAWMLWSDTSRIYYVKGFITGTSAVAEYASLLAWGAHNRSRNLVSDASAAGGCFPSAKSEDLLTFTEQAVTALADASNFRFRVGAYILELDCLYRDPANRKIQLIDAMYIANERLNGREVDLNEWRKKRQ